MTVYNFGAHLEIEFTSKVKTTQMYNTVFLLASFQLDDTINFGGIKRCYKHFWQHFVLSAKRENWCSIILNHFLPKLIFSYWTLKNLHDWLLFLCIKECFIIFPVWRARNTFVTSTAIRQLSSFLKLQWIKSLFKSVSLFFCFSHSS